MYQNKYTYKYMTTLENIGDIGDSGYVMKRDINNILTSKKNRASGNCLFESLSQSVYGNMTKQAYIRKLVCDFRKNISDFSPTNSLDYRVKEFLEADETDLTICIDKEYALALDVLIAAVVLQKNIILFTDKENINVSESDKVYNLERFEYGTNVDTIYILFRPYNENHDEPNHFESLKPNKIVKKKTENSKKKRKIVENDENGRKMKDENDDYNLALQLDEFEKMNEIHRKSQERSDEIYARSLMGGKRNTIRRKIKNKRRRTIRKSK